MNPLLEARRIRKSFSAVPALDGVSLELQRGEVHAVVGENGAGKSTLMKILAGILQPDAGELYLEGKPVVFRNPHEALKNGVCMIHQELLPFPDLTVAENILIGREPASRFIGWIDRKSMHREAEQLLSRLRVNVRPSCRMGGLRLAEMQGVEIAKALGHEARVIIMDEPTSALTEQETESLFELIRDLRQRQVTVVYISHRLDEVFRLADRVTVLRDGHRIGTHVTSNVDASQLVTLMAGRDLQLQIFGAPTSNRIGTFEVEPSPDSDAEPPAPEQRGGNMRSRTNEALLSVEGLTRHGRFRNISFQVRAGEILGLAGMMGAGRTDILNAIYGLAPADVGEIRVRNRAVSIKQPRDAIQAGISLVSEDRKVYGIIPKLPVTPNITLSALDTCCRGLWLQKRAETRVAAEQIQALRIKVSGPSQTVDHLSGGNQQKVVLARALLTKPEILLLDEPTRGIDVGAKAEVHVLVRNLANEGKAVVLVSSELPELLALSDRVLVLREGIVTAELDPRQTTQAELLRFAIPT